jgi:hypothetical protein
MSFLKPSDSFKYSYNQFFYKIDINNYESNLNSIYNVETGFYNSLKHDIEMAMVYKKIEHDPKYVTPSDSIFGDLSNVHEHTYFSLEDLFKANVVNRKIQLVRVSNVYKFYFEQIKEYINFCESMIKVENTSFKPIIYNPEFPESNVRITKDVFFSIIDQKIDELISIDIMNPTNEIKINDYENITSIIEQQISKVSGPGVYGLVRNFRFKSSHIPKIWLSPIKKHNLIELKMFLKAISDVFNLSYIIHNYDNPKWFKRIKLLINDPERQEKVFGYIKTEGTHFFDW